MLSILLISVATHAQVTWTAKLDGDARFYQTTELGVLVVGTEKSLYAVDAATGDVLWRRKARGLDETDVAAVPGTDLLLVALADGERSRLEAVDLLGGGTVWRTDAQRGGVMGMAVDTDARLLAVTLVRDARAKAKEGFRRKARTHVFDLATGRELVETRNFRRHRDDARALGGRR
jgi:outer membrane protein assembly factor BamB